MTAPASRPDKVINWLEHRKDLATQRLDKAQEDLRILRQAISRIRTKRLREHVRA